MQSAESKSKEIEHIQEESSKEKISYQKSRHFSIEKNETLLNSPENNHISNSKVYFTLSKRQYICDYCGNSYRRQSRLYIHKRTHVSFNLYN